MDKQKTTDTPIIGILSQETYSVRKFFKAEDNVDSYIAASYVKFLESAGARVIPVWIGQSEDYYERVVKYTNGLLFPGGATYFNETDGYGQAAKIIFKFAKNANENDSYYPLLGICLGMEVFMYANVGEDIRVNCDAKKMAVPLNFTNDYNTSRLLSKAPNDIIDILKTENVTYNYHQYCLTSSVLKENNLLSDWRILSTNIDINEFEFVSMLESVRYPFYGVQFHPEKNLFEFKRDTNIPHTVEAVRSSQYFANFFVDECRKSGHVFPRDDLEKKSLIYNFTPLYTGLEDSSYEQIYRFTKNDYITHQLQ